MPPPRSSPEMQSKGLLIMGAGGHGKVVADAALQQRCWRSIAFYDNDETRRSPLPDVPLYGPSRPLDRLTDEYPDALVAIGDAARRLKLIRQLKAHGFQIPSVQHPGAVVSPYATIGSGCALLANCVINADTTLGTGCIINTGATVDHDCELGDGVHIAPGAHVAGGVSIGPETWIGIGACIRQNITIGKGVAVGAGSAVICDIGDALTVAGVPAKESFRS